MSTSLASKPLTMAQRAAVAAEQACVLTHFTDAKRLTAALMELAVEELERNPSFSLRVRSRYDDLAPQKADKAPKAPKKPRTPKPAASKVQPIKRIEGLEIDPSAPLDPYLVLEIYGAEQFADALRAQTKGNLQEAVEIVQERHPGTAPKSLGSKEPMIAYLVAQLTGTHAGA